MDKKGYQDRLDNIREQLAKTKDLIEKANVDIEEMNAIIDYLENKIKNL